MKARIRNNRRAPYGVEITGGGYRFIKPGEERTVDVANPRLMENEPEIDFTPAPDLKAPPASLAQKATAPKPAEPKSTAAKAPAKPRKTRRRKAPSR